MLAATSMGSSFLGIWYSVSFGSIEVSNISGEPSEPMLDSRLWCKDHRTFRKVW